MPAYTLTGTASDIVVQRILVRLGLSRDMATLLLGDLRNAVPSSPSIRSQCPMTREEASGFSHL